jgi:hypothetical protein
MWTVGDSFKSATDVPSELLTFDEYADQIMKEVRVVFDKVKETKLFNGNKGFRKTLYSEKIKNTRSETPNTRNHLNISTVLPKLR